MITIMIAQDEARIKELLKKLLKEEGYDFSGSLAEHGDIIRIAGKDDVGSASSLTDKVIELEESIYNEKRGGLYKAILDKVEKPMIEHTLERTEGNQLKAARVLGINRNTIRTKIKRLGIDVSRWKASSK